MIEIKLLSIVGSFAENKDLAKEIRLKKIIPALETNKEIALDFDGIDTATQSFIHALISDLLTLLLTIFLRISSKRNENSFVAPRFAWPLWLKDSCYLYSPT